MIFFNSLYKNVFSQFQCDGRKFNFAIFCMRQYEGVLTWLDTTESLKSYELWCMCVSVCAWAYYSCICYKLALDEILQCLSFLCLSTFFLRNVHCIIYKRDTCSEFTCACAKHNNWIDILARSYWHRYVKIHVGAEI